MSLNTIEIILPEGRGRKRHILRGAVRAKDLARRLAKDLGLDVQKRRWQLRGPLGTLHPQKIVKTTDLAVGEALKLEEKHR